jgi:MOSC domain-containing protein YiiM
MASLLSVNLGRLKPSAYADSGVTGIDKRPSEKAVQLRDPGRGTGRSGATGDAIGDPTSHGGSDQAVYAFAREDLDEWQGVLGRQLTNGVFGENLTTIGLDVNAALVGERWQVGDTCVLEVTSPRIPCRTFAGWLEDQLLVKRFTERGAPGPYLRVITPGFVASGDPITVIHRPEHDVTIEMMFRALTTEKVLQPQLVAAGDALPEFLRRRLVP